MGVESTLAQASLPGEDTELLTIRREIARRNGLYAYARGASTDSGVMSTTVASERPRAAVRSSRASVLRPAAVANL
jgi:hypothetical protein